MTELALDALIQYLRTINPYLMMMTKLHEVKIQFLIKTQLVDKLQY